MKSLTILFAELTKYFGCVALVSALVLSAWRAIRHHAEMKLAKAAFQTLELQAKLGKLSAEMKELETCPSYARNFKVKAATTAYDHLLAEACVRAGLNAEPQCKYQDVERLRRERALNAIGWAW